MNIVLLVQNLHGRDGWSRYAKDLSMALAKRDHEIVAFVQEKTSDVTWCKQVTCLRPPLHSLSPAGMLLQAAMLWLPLTKEKADIVHVICEPYALPLALLPGHRNSVITIHGTYAVAPFTSGAMARAMTKRAFRQASAIVSVSNFTKGFVKKHEPAFFAEAGLEQKITVIHNAITLGNEVKYIERTANDGPKSIIGVGAVKSRKGFLQAIRALSTFKKTTNVPFRYDIIGSVADKAYVATLEAEILSLGLKDNVRIRGQISEPELINAYERADLFLLLSLEEGTHVEGFVLGFLEAAARGVPCIGPTTGGCPEAIEDGKTGYVRDPNDAVSVANAMKKVLSEGAIDRRACRTWAEAHDVREAAMRMEEVYRKMPA